MMSNFDDIRKWLESLPEDGEPKYKKFNIWLPIDKLPIESSDILAHRAVPAPIVPALEKQKRIQDFYKKQGKGAE